MDLTEERRDLEPKPVDRYTSHVISHAVCTTHFMHITLHGSMTSV